jgi:hypothetical protein
MNEERLEHVHSVPHSVSQSVSMPDNIIYYFATLTKGILNLQDKWQAMSLFNSNPFSKLFCLFAVKV